MERLKMELLYHYCSNQNFHSIVTGSSIWLSSLSMSNDSLEGKLVTKFILHLAQKDNLPPHHIERLSSDMNIILKRINDLGFCLSIEGDLLSQWRGYASNASGVSIGFSKTALTELAKKTNTTLEKVEYNRDKQIKAIKPIYSKIKQWITEKDVFAPETQGLLDTRTKTQFQKDKENAKKRYNEFILTLSATLKHFLKLKSEAFKEEKEWRLLVKDIVSTSNLNSYRATQKSIIPYHPIKLKTPSNKIIKQIILGPKNQTPVKTIQDFLQHNDFQDVDVIKSKASYR